MMKTFITLIIFAIQLPVFSQPEYVFAEGSRDPYKQPFSSFSIWNMPIGSEAEYIPAKLERAMARGMTIDEDLIVLTPDAPLTEIYVNNAGWNAKLDRCVKEGDLMYSAPIPAGFLISPDNWDGSTPNSGLAVLMADGRTIKQTQPFSRCREGGYATSKYTFDDQDLYGDGYYGAHGATALSAIGGSLRVGELVKGAGPIKHVLKINLFARNNIYYDDIDKGFRWPAKRADGYAADEYGKGRTGPPVKECRMGALFALPPGVYETLDFETEPGRMLAQAFRDYGAYVVDDTAWDVYAICTEWSPEGRVKDEFRESWGFDFAIDSKDTPWARDMDRIFLNLHIVNNNSPERIGGGGRPLVPLSPPLPEQ